MPRRSTGAASPERRLPLRKSLLGRLLAVSALVAACSVAATAWLAVQTTSGAIKQEQGQNLTDDARIYHTLLGYAATHPRWDDVGATVGDLARQTGRRIALTTSGHAPLADSAQQAKPPALPSKPSAVVDPLSADSALAAGDSPSSADRIDPRAVGPFRLPASERDRLQGIAKRAVSCLRSYGVTSDILSTPSGRPRLQAVGRDPDRMQGTRCAQDSLEQPTATETKALTALEQLANACLKRRHRPGVRLNLDLSWTARAQHGGPGSGAPTPAPAWPEPGEPGSGAPSAAPAPASSPVPSPAATGDDRAVASCVGTARREQLSSYVAAPALLFIGDPDTGTVPGFDLSPANTARIAGAAALVLALTVGASLLAATRLVRPLRALTGAAQRMKSGGYADPVPVPTTADNEIGRLATAFNDMAAHRARLEKQRKAMVSDVAHELRTPLSNIRGWLEAAQDGLADPDPAFVSSLLEEAVQLQHIIGDLQDLAQADAGALRLHPEQVRIDELLGQVAAAHQAQADAGGVTLEVCVPQEIPALRADPVRLRQAVGNLMSNAIRHTPPGGGVTLRVRGAGAETVTVEVADTGSGIPAEDLPYVFDRFWRAEKSRNRRTGGSGLGLAIVRNLAEAHGGSVHVTSVAGEGSVFTVILPPGGPDAMTMAT